MEKICCFTGHREISNRDAAYLSEAMDNALERMIEEGVTVFRVGGARGFDIFAALKVINLRKKYGFVRLHLILPCVDQADRWHETEKKYYNYVLSCADETTYTSRDYFRGCMQLRNRTLVEGADFCIAYCNKNDGGTAYTVKYAEKMNVEVINVART